MPRLIDLLYNDPKAYWGEKAQKLGDLLSGAAETGANAYAGASQPYTTEQANTIGGLLADFTPVLGDIKSGYEGVQAAKQGDWLGAGLGALGALPLVPNMAGIMKGMTYEQILAKQRALEGMQAAMRDPVTGTVLTGRSHQAAINKVPQGEATGMWGRLSSEWDQATDNTGFIDKSGEFITRSQAEKNLGVSTMEDIKDALRSRFGTHGQ